MVSICGEVKFLTSLGCTSTVDAESVIDLRDMMPPMAAIGDPIASRELPGK